MSLILASVCYLFQNLAPQESVLDSVFIPHASTTPSIMQCCPRRHVATNTDAVRQTCKHQRYVVNRQQLALEMCA